MESSVIDIQRGDGDFIVVRKIHGSVEHDADKYLPASKGFNLGGDIIGHCGHLFLYLLGADIPLSPWNSNIDGLCCLVRLYCSSISINN